MADKKRFRIKDRNGTVVPYDIAVEDITIDGEHKSLPQKLAEMAAAIVEASQSWTPTEESIAMANLSLAVQALLAKAGSAVQPDDLSPINEAINTINRAIDAITGTTDTTDLIDSLNEVVDFLTGIENDETLSGKLLALQNAIDGKQDALTFDKAPTAGSDNPVESGGVFAALDEKADADKVYDKDTVDTKLDEVAADRAAIISLEEVDIIDQHDNNTVLAGASARQMKLAYIAINAIYGKLNELISALAGMAFSGEKTQLLAALDWTGAITQYTLTPSLSACTASITRGDAGNSKLYEGLVVIRLTPSSPTYTFSNIIVTKAGTAMDIDRTDNQDGTVDISFVCSGDVTVTATAVDGYAVSLYNSPHVNVSQTHSGSTYTATIVADEHFSLPDEIVVKKGVTTLQRNTDYTYNKETGKVVIYNVNEDITIIATATEEDHVVLDLTAVGSNVIVKNGNNLLIDGAHLYNSSVLTITLEPEVGFKFAATPSAVIGSSPASMSGNSVYGGYSFVVDTNVANGTTVAVTASAVGLVTCNISVPSDANITVDNGSGGSVPASVLEGTALTIRLTPANDFSINVSSAKMGQSDLTPTNNNGVLTFTIASVTDHVTIVATAVEFVAHAIRNHFINMVSSNPATMVEDRQSYSTVLSADTGAESNKDLRVFIGSQLMTADTDYTYDSATGELNIPAAKVTGDIDICMTASTGKITITVKAGMSTTAKFVHWGRDSSTTNDVIYNNTIDATNSQEDITVEIPVKVIESQYNPNGLRLVSYMAIGTKSAVKRLDFGGCKTEGGGTAKLNFDGFTALESSPNIAYVETANNASVTLSNMFKDCKSLRGTLDLMTWRCNSQNNIIDMLRMCTADKVIMPYLPALTTMKQVLHYSQVKEIVFNKTGSVTNMNNFAYDAYSIKVIDLTKATISSPSDISFFFTNGAASNVTLKIGNFNFSGVSTSQNDGIKNKVSKLVCTTSTPPNSALLSFLSSSIDIYVPNVTEYQTAWPSFANNIHPMSDYIE